MGKNIRLKANRYSVELGYPSRAQLLNAIYKKESDSGKDTRVRVPNSVGALGGYQITPIALQEVINNYPEKYRNVEHSDLAHNDVLGREVANDYLEIMKRNLMRKKFSPTADLLAGSYNASDNIYKKNTKTGPEVSKYIRDVMSNVFRES